LTNDELESTVLDPPPGELFKEGSGEFVDDTAAGVFVGAGDELPVLLCIANLFAAPRSRLRSKRNNARMKDRMESIIRAHERPVQTSSRSGGMICIPN
jgi:hypothetical protein